MGNRDKYDSAFKAVRGQAVERDRSRCVKCGLTLELEVHHIDGYECNDLDKLVTLCYFCHGIAPMGKQEFDQWMVFGKDGVDSIRERLAKNGLPRIKREHVIIFCKTLVELEFNTRKGKLKAARDRIKANMGKCEGRKSYGTKPGEAEVVEKMKELHARGKNPKVIARELNIAGVPTRGTKHGKSPWHPSTIAKILTKEGLIEVKPRPKKIDLPKVPTVEKSETALESDDDKEFWLEVERELAKGPLPSSMLNLPIPKPKPRHLIDYTLKPTDRGGVWVPVMMNGAELRQV